MPIDPDYVDVAERIAEFYAKYPDGRLTCESWDVRDLPGDRVFVVYQALAYRTPDDPLPGQGTAWEPFPGPTSFTKDSELMNAETSAWGRAIVAVGIPSKKIASREEVQARAGSPVEAAEKPPPGYGQPPSHRRPSPAQEARIKLLISRHKVSRLELAGILDHWDIVLEEGWLDRLSPGRDGTASELIGILERLEKPQVDA